MGNVPRISEEYKADAEFCEMAYVFSHDVKFLHDFFLDEVRCDYEMLRAAAVLRRLILDKHSSALVLAKRCGLKFHICIHKKWPKETQTKFEDLPEIHRLTAMHTTKGEGPYYNNFGWEVHDVGKYLSHSLGMLNYVHVTPALLIKILANKLGGIHHDKRFLQQLNDEERKLTAIYASSRSVRIMGQSPLMLLTRDMAFHIFHACSPILRTLVLNEVIDDVLAKPVDTQSEAGKD
jgi:hypothetical protein